MNSIMRPSLSPSPGENRFTSISAILDVCPIGVVGVGADGKVVYANAAFSSLSGLNAAELVGISEDALNLKLRANGDPAKPFEPCKSPAVALPELPAAKTIAVIPLQPAFCAQRDGTECGCDVTLIKPVRRHLRRTARFLDDPATGLTRVLFFDDITRERAADELKRQLMVTAAHEFRTPLTMINGFAETMLMREHDAESRADMLRTLLHHGKHLAKAMDNVLDLARLEGRVYQTLPLAKLDLREVLLGACASFIFPGDARRPELDLPESAVQFDGDRTLLTQCVHELLTNAYRFSFGHGRILVAMEMRERDGIRWACFSVADEGIGMTDEDQALAFDPFWRADKSGSNLGCGLGLPLVKEIATLHRGRVELSSGLAEGTKVTVWLPTPS